MYKKITLILLSCLKFNSLIAENNTINSIKADSTLQAAHASYNKVSGIHRWLFGENYRSDWAMPVKLPVLHLSTWHGGLPQLNKAAGWNPNRCA
jgi:hypothetical protein